MKKTLTNEQIKLLYNEYQTPEHVIRHCKGVTNCSMAIATALNNNGLHLDIDLIYAAGMTHDVARTSENHGLVIAKRLIKDGYEDVAKIVKVHMRYNGFTDLNKINETDIVCLGDRLVKEDKYVGLDERIEYIIDKAGRTPEICERLYAKKEETRKFINMIENIVGMTIDEIVDSYIGDEDDK